MRRGPLLFAGLVLLAVACDGGAPGADGGDDAVADGGDDAVAEQPGDAGVVFVSPEAAETVGSPVAVEFDVEGVELAEAGEPTVGEGHVHVLVDRGCVDDGEVIPGPSEDVEADGIFHFGDGSAEGELDLETGEHELCAQLGDGAHRAFGATDEIQIAVE